MVLIRRLAFDGIPESGLSSACALGGFAPDGSTVLVASALGLVFREVQAGFERLRGAKVVLAGDPGGQLGTIDRIQTLLGPTVVAGAAVLIKLVEGSATGAILKLGDLAPVREALPVRLLSAGAGRTAIVARASSLFRPVSAALGGSDVLGFDIETTDGADFEEQDSGAPVVDENNALVGMLVYGSGPVAHCVTASSLFF
ncbi:hypothetical protein [Gloeobacter kilaueensis]|uniref:Uncharacterized protein n=1 Tax=Gloeobacter kilaueensis (strain ATCC BAA-2537 / CCAP 1431/1 / ULC 316 / JS1) TaxID=1183438 RepID=U5QM05_GLOK1|nr:hypothetical protein [Gloeobacter kilaueensis]AGY58715.1 hypothetical protein GKIL_2469 [Gloeobacter kilaueensis JS1]